ncbi:MAG: hypothetical protein ACK4K0_09810 [Flavobacteriales bacterium]
MRLFLLFALALSCISTFAQERISPNGIRSSKLNIELANETASLNMLDSAVENFRLYFTGENHLFRESNYKLELKLIQYLNKKAGVNHLLLEFGQSIGYAVNHYVQTGDTATQSILKHYFYPEYLSLFEGIRDYNKNLDSTKTLQIHGIDLERAPEITIKVLSEFLPKDLSNLPDSVAVSVESIIGLASHYDQQKINNITENKSKQKPYYTWNSQTYNLNKSVKLIIEEYKSNKPFFKHIIGDRFNVFDSVMNDLEKSYVWNDLSLDRTIQQAIYREKFLYNRFISIYESYPDGSFFGQFGRCHIMTDENDPNCAYEAFRSLAKRVNENESSPLCGKVLPLPIYYLNTGYRYNDAHITEKLIKELKLKDFEGVTLVEINQDSTYFKDFPKGFSHILINTFPSGNQSSSSSATASSVKKPIYKSYSSIDIFGQSGFFANDNFASFMKNYFPAYEMYSGIGVASTVYGRRQTFGNIRTAYYSLFKIVSGDSLSLNLSGFETSFNMGYSPLAGKMGALSLFGGVGFANWKLQETIIRESDQQTTDTYFFTPSNTKETTNKYRNPSLVLDLGFDARIKTGFMYLFVSGTYRYDVSSEQWRYKGKRMENTPGKNNGGIYLQGGIGIPLD